ncbi:hypothetical protein J2W42_006394 [Rhizobium tibeticum]|nr:hypothetical protein [Rhizobium tibeticum]
MEFHASQSMAKDGEILPQDGEFEVLVLAGLMPVPKIERPSANNLPPP